MREFLSIFNTESIDGIKSDKTLRINSVIFPGPLPGACSGLNGPGTPQAVKNDVQIAEDRY